jgi:hypothetical protein
MKLSGTVILGGNSDSGNLMTGAVLFDDVSDVYRDLLNESCEFRDIVAIAVPVSNHDSFQKAISVESCVLVLSNRPVAGRTLIKYPLFAANPAASKNFSEAGALRS